MMREVSGAFCGSRKLDEALGDLQATGIASDRIRVARMSGFADFQMSIALSASSPTQWIIAEHVGQADPYEALDIASSGDDILPDFDRSDTHGPGAEGFGSITRVVVTIRDEAEMRAVCDIFSRLGTDDLDAKTAAA
ncbi:hypothetical protein [Caballeronia grimmiae]|uniref:hypothetical protein n=1 Tax=Caballeronia grimmiae TaxID=1071679 RepID=UPI0038B955FF